jgi:hypothetical protein
LSYYYSIIIYKIQLYSIITVDADARVIIVMVAITLLLGNPEGFKPDQIVSYSISPNTTNFKPDIVYLQGDWKNNPDNTELQSDTGVIGPCYAFYAISHQ